MFRPFQYDIIIDELVSLSQVLKFSGTFGSSGDMKILLHLGLGIKPREKIDLGKEILNTYFCSI